MEDTSMATSETTQEPTALVRPNGTSYTEETFSLAKTNEIADRFRGDHTIRYHLPVAVPGDLEATLANLREFVDPAADFASVLVAKFNGQGHRLDVQKAIKTSLSPEKASDETTLEQAQEAALSFKQGAVKPKSERKAREGKVAQAEAKASQATNTAVQMYADLSRAARKQYRAMLLNLGTVTEAELDAIDQA
jgi:hypothetical protein